MLRHAIPCTQLDWVSIQHLTQDYVILNQVQDDACLSKNRLPRRSLIAMTNLTL